jgi:hypothetical protein
MECTEHPACVFLTHYDESAAIEQGQCCSNEQQQLLPQEKLPDADDGCASLSVDGNDVN